MPLLK